MNGRGIIEHSRPPGKFKKVLGTHILPMLCKTSWKRYRFRPETGRNAVLQALLTGSPRGSSTMDNASSHFYNSSLF